MEPVPLENLYLFEDSAADTRRINIHLRTQPPRELIDLLKSLRGIHSVTSGPYQVSFHYGRLFSSEELKNIIRYEMGNIGYEEAKP